MINTVLNKKDLNELLRKALCERNTTDVQLLLEKGADPNYCLGKEAYNNFDVEYEQQPYSPLRLLVFIISDALIGDKELLADAKAATLLLKHGADPLTAIELAEKRYGKFDAAAQSTAFTEVLRIIYNAK